MEKNTRLEIGLHHIAKQIRVTHRSTIITHPLARIPSMLMTTHHPPHPNLTAKKNGPRSTSAGQRSPRFDRIHLAIRDIKIRNDVTRKVRGTHLDLLAVTKRVFALRQPRRLGPVAGLMSGWIQMSTMTVITNTSVRMNANESESLQGRLRGNESGSESENDDENVN